MKLKTILAVVIMTIAIIFAVIFGLLLWLDNLSNSSSQELTMYNCESTEIIASHIYIPTTKPISTTTLIIPKATPIIEHINIIKPSKSFVSITISTDKKTRTYEIMSNVDKKTLKKNIGWLPGSALPGYDGLCVLMGHRDTDFSILQYVIAGNIITITMSGKQYKYQVTKIEIVDSDNALRFDVQGGSNLALVTCYPFRYSGHAQKKYIVYGVIKNT